MPVQRNPRTGELVGLGVWESASESAAIVIPACWLSHLIREGDTAVDLVWTMLGYRAAGFPFGFFLLTLISQNAVRTRGAWARGSTVPYVQLSLCTQARLLTIEPVN